MAQEFVQTVGFTFTKNSTEVRYSNNVFEIDISGDLASDNIQSYTAGTMTDANVGSAGGGCRVLIINLDGTNYIEWGYDSGGSTFVPIGKVGPGEPSGFFQLASGVTLKIRAHTGNCKVRVIAIPA